MKKTLPYMYWQLSSPALIDLEERNKLVNLKKMIEENAVIVLSLKSCCLGHVVKCLLHGLGTNPTIYEVEDKDVNCIIKELEKRGESACLKFPVVFIGGRWFGGLDTVMAAHITGDLTPLLKQVGALWL